MELKRIVDPILLFKTWLSEAEKKEIRDPNAMQLATVSKNGMPSVRTVLLKDIINGDFVFYTNYESRKSEEINETAKGAICFHWKSLRRQVRIIGSVKKVSDKEADKYYNSRSYDSRISAWASSQSEAMKSREMLIKKINEFKIKYPNKDDVPRPPHWSGWRIEPKEIEFWLDGEFRVHERLNYIKKNDDWIKEILYP